jgi:hypothetical protein
MELVARLQELGEQHATTEEIASFPRCGPRCRARSWWSCGGKVDTARKLAPTRPHPDAPNAELFHKLVGPGVG